jgi:hypothetical protein
MDIREHATRAVDYSIRVALIGIVAVPIWFCAWWFTGLHPGEEAHPTADLICGMIGIPGFVFLSPGFASMKLLATAHVPFSVPFSLLYWLAAFITVPAFWGTLIYSLVQLSRHFRVSRPRTTNRRDVRPSISDL